MTDISRRSFLQGSALGVAGILGPLAITHAGVAVADEATPAATEEVAPSQDGKTYSIAENYELPSVNIKQPGDPSILNIFGQIDPVKYVTDIPRSQLHDLLLDEEQDVADYTTPDGVVIPAVYIKLRNRANRMWGGIGAGVGTENNTGHEWDVFMKNWTEEEAQATVDAPGYQWFVVNDLCQINGKSYDENRKVLDAIADKGLLWRRYVGSQPQYYIMGQLPGYWEIGQMELVAQGKEEEAAQFAADCALAMGNGVKYIFDGYRPITRIMPASGDIIEGDWAPFTNWEETLKQFDSFVIAPCQCRQKKDLLADYLGGEERACRHDHYQETCLNFGAVADYYKEIGIGVPVTQEEAIQRVKDSVAMGLVVDGELKRDGGTYCACHSDCCQLLGKMNLMYQAGKVPTCIEFVSDYDLLYNKDACIMCGQCEQRCPMFSITEGEDGFYQMNEMCIRCGQCATVCPQGARKLQARPREETMGYTWDAVENGVEYAMIRMAQGRIRDFNGSNGDEIYPEPEER